MQPPLLDYTLDPALVAQHPLPERDAARLMVVARGSGVVAHTCIRDLGTWLHPGDLLVMNDAAVVPARLRGKRSSGGAVEVLLTERIDDDGRWRCLARGAQRIRPGERTVFARDLEAIWGERVDDVFRELQLIADGDLSSTVEARAEVPLPPYIRRPKGPSREDRIRYQTTFARVPGAVAAPTAGLHFTPELLDALARRGIHHATLTLLVGPGTFLPIRTDTLESHRVPAERYEISATTASAIASVRKAGGRVVAVGTTTVRALESATDDAGVHAGVGRTDLVIGPGHAFRAVDAILTNFHLPRSSLLALVAAFAGMEPTLAAYREATSTAYRFYSYGDAMLIQ